MVSHGICGIVTTDFPCVDLHLEGKNVSGRITKLQFGEKRITRYHNGTAKSYT